MVSKGGEGLPVIRFGVIGILIALLLKMKVS